MAKTKLLLKPYYANTQGDAPIFVRYSHGDKTVDFSTGERVPPKYWDKVQQQVRKSYKGYIGINNLIEQKKLEIDAIRLDLKAKRIEPSVQAIKQEYNKKDITVEAPQSQFIFDHWSRFIDHQKQIKRLADATLRQYSATLKKFNEFEQHIKCRLTFTMIDNSFLDEFKRFMYNHEQSSNNTIGGKVKHLKSFLNWAYSNGLTNNAKFKNFKKPTNDTTIVTLTKEQLDIIYYLDLKAIPRLDRARDLFILGCSTGLRYSDYSSVKLANVKGDFLVISTEKTDIQVRIPLNDYSRSIINKYPNGLPTLSNVNLNKYLKEVGIKAKFFEEHEVTTYRGGRKEKFFQPLYQLLTSHCARRTFATQSLARGMMMHDVMRVTGHKDVRSFMRYVHIAEPRLQKEVSKAWDTLEK
jgi:site-specific recombinase XerD